MTCTRMIKLKDLLSEDLFGTSLKLKPHETLMVKSVVEKKNQKKRLSKIKRLENSISLNK